MKKIQLKKLDFKKANLTELNSQKMNTIMGGSTPPDGTIDTGSIFSWGCNGGGQQLNQM